MIPIHNRNVPPAYETFDHIGFIEFLAGWIKPESYLEIGVRDGKCLSRISKKCKISYGVDINPPKVNLGSDVVLMTMTSDEFFLSLDDDIMFDLVFIDGDHSRYQVIKDFLNVSKRVIDDGFVILHDTYPCNTLMMGEEYSHSAWESVLFFKNNFMDEWEILTLPFNHGVTIMKKIGKDKQLVWYNN